MLKLKRTKGKDSMRAAHSSLMGAKTGTVSIMAKPKLQRKVGGNSSNQPTNQSESQKHQSFSAANFSASRGGKKATQAPQIFEVSHLEIICPALIGRRRSAVKAIQRRLRVDALNDEDD